MCVLDLFLSTFLILSVLLKKQQLTKTYSFVCEHICPLNIWFWFWFWLNRKNDIAVVSLSDQKDIALEVTVKNRNGDDAHEAKLTGRFDDSLSYSGFRSQKTTVRRRHRASIGQTICVYELNILTALSIFKNRTKTERNVL